MINILNCLGSCLSHYHDRLKSQKSTGVPSRLKNATSTETVQPGKHPDPELNPLLKNSEGSIISEGDLEVEFSDLKLDQLLNNIKKSIISACDLEVETFTSKNISLKLNLNGEVGWQDITLYQKMIEQSIIDTYPEKSFSLTIIYEGNLNSIMRFKREEAKECNDEM